MTTQTPTPKASSVSALLASLSTVPPPPPAPVSDDFLAMILQALTARPGGTDNPPAAQPVKEGEKPVSTNPAAPDPTAASLLLAWLAPPLLTPAQLLPHKGSASSARAGASVPTAQAAPTQAGADAKATKNAAVEKSPIAPGQDASSKEAD